jgi:sensor histidine kinase YesM
MAKSIKEMVEGLKEKAELEALLHEEELALVSMGKALREAQFMNLQEQMKPHFLFNALNTIARSALLEKAPRTEALSMGLATLLRATLRDSGPLSSLDDELALAQAYLEFQRARFGERLQWKIDVPSPLRCARVPRLMVQPLVENAVRHGLEPKVEGGFLSIRARMRGGNLTLWVLDNGIGISSERLVEVRAGVAAALSRLCERKKSFAEPDLSVEYSLLEGTGIGLTNLATRFGILYGDRCRFDIVSRPERGTLVRVAIPTGGAAE